MLLSIHLSIGVFLHCNVELLCVTVIVLSYLRTFVMAALCNGTGHNIFAMWFLLSFFFLPFPRLISAVPNWMSTIHNNVHASVRIYDAGLKRTARGSLEMQDAKNRQIIASRHHSTTLSGCIFATKAYIDNRKNLLNSNISCRCPHNMANFGPLTAEIAVYQFGAPLQIWTDFASWQRYWTSL